MINQQSSLAGEVTTFMHRFGWWNFECTLQYHKTKIFMEKMVLISDGQRMLWSQKVWGNAFSNDLKIQIYWLSKLQKNSIFDKKTAVDKSAWIKAWCVYIYIHIYIHIYIYILYIYIYIYIRSLFLKDKCISSLVRTK